MILYKLISPSETYELRHQILRPLEPIEACHYPHDHDQSSFHFGAFHENQIVGISSFYLENFYSDQPLKLKSNQSIKLSYRLRGMATRSEFVGKGIGKGLIQSGEAELKRLDCDLLWFNARLIALGFYKKQGFIIHGDQFEIKNIGPHFVMYKIL